MSQASWGAPFQEELSTEEVIYYFHNDHLGTPQIVMDGKGLVVWKSGHKPFGEAKVDPNPTVVNNLRFPGQYFDEETGLHYNWHRYHSPQIGRYLKPDPIGLYAGVNRYAYVINNPIMLIDILGLCRDSLYDYWRERFKIYYDFAREDITTTLIDSILTPIPPGELPPGLSPYVYLITLADCFLDISQAAVCASRDTAGVALHKAYWKIIVSMARIDQRLRSYYWGRGQYWP